MRSRSEIVAGESKELERIGATEAKSLRELLQAQRKRIMETAEDRGRPGLRFRGRC